MHEENATQTDIIAIIISFLQVKSFKRKIVFTFAAPADAFRYQINKF